MILFRLFLYARRFWPHICQYGKYVASTKMSYFMLIKLLFGFQFGGILLFNAIFSHFFSQRHTAHIELFGNITLADLLVERSAYNYLVDCRVDGFSCLIGIGDCFT